MSSWPDIVLLLSTRCLYWGWRCQGSQQGHWGYIWKMKTVYCKVLLKTQDGLLQTIEHELKSMGTKLVPLLATRCLYLGTLRGIGGDGVGVHLTKHQPDPQDDQMSHWPAVVLLFTTRCLNRVGGVKWANRGNWSCIWKIKMVYCKVLLKTQDGLLQTIEHELKWMEPKLVPLMATRCLYLGALRGIGVMGWGYIWQNISLTQRMTKCHADLQYYYSLPLDACTWLGVSRGALTVTYEKLRWPIAKYSWKLKIVYCRQ